MRSKYCPVILTTLKLSISKNLGALYVAPMYIYPSVKHIFSR